MKPPSETPTERVMRETGMDRLQAHRHVQDRERLLRQQQEARGRMGRA